MTTVKAERFVLTDSNGSARAELGISSGGPVLAFYDGDGVPRLKLGVSDATSGVVVFDREGHKLAELDAIRPGLVLYEDGQIRAALGIAPLGGSLALYRDDGKPIAVLGVDVDASTSALSLYGANGKVQAKLITDSSHLFLFGADGKTVWKAP